MHPAMLAAVVALTAATAVAQPGRQSTIVPEGEQMTAQRRDGAVDFNAVYDTSDLRIPESEIHALLPRDAIPSITDPTLQTVEEATWLDDDDRIIDIAINGQRVGVPLRILNRHEVANITIGGSNIAATYCPLCDSATVFSRDLTTTNDDGESTTQTLDFGVSGCLYNSNVLMYDRTSMGLWSQLKGECVSGPLAGTSLDHLPVRIVSFASFKRTSPFASIVSNDNGLGEGAYDGNPYQRYFDDPDFILVPIRAFDDRIARKTLGLGVYTPAGSYFVPKENLGERFVLETTMGKVIAHATDAGIAVDESPQGVRTAQTFYYSWTAFHGQVEIVTESADD